MTSAGHVIALIEDAFAMVRRPSRERFSHCGLCDLWLERFLQTSEQDWRSLSAADISHEYAALTAVTPAGWKFLAPAYMTCYVKNPRAESNTREHLLLQLTLRETDDAQKRDCFDRLELRQKRAVREFLEYVASATDEERVVADAEAALDSYWRKASG